MFQKTVFSLMACFYIMSGISQTKSTATFREEIDELASRYLELGRFSGIILIGNKDSIFYSNSFGKANYEQNISFSEKTAFKVGELTELFTEAIIRNLEAEGAVNFDTPVSNYLPELSADYTLRQLLEHRSGLTSIATVKESYPNKSYSLIEFAELAPKTKSQRSDLGYNLLGLIIEKVTGKPYEEAIANLAVRLDMENTFYKQESLDDMATGYLYHYDQNLLQQKPASVYKLEEAFSSKGIKTTPHDLLKLINHLPKREYNEEAYLQNDGFSYSLQSTDGRVILVLSNRRHPIAGEITRSIAAILEDRNFQTPLPRKEILVENDILKEYAGLYIMNPKMDLEVIQSNDSLFVLMGSQKVHLIPQSKNQFFMQQGDTAMRFKRNSAGKVTSAELLDGFLNGHEIPKRQ